MSRSVWFGRVQRNCPRLLLPLLACLAILPAGAAAQVYLDGTGDASTHSDFDYASQTVSKNGRLHFDLSMVGKLNYPGVQVLHLQVGEHGCFKVNLGTSAEHPGDEGMDDRLGVSPRLIQPGWASGLFVTKCDRGPRIPAKYRRVSIGVGDYGYRLAFDQRAIGSPKSFAWQAVSYEWNENGYDRVDSIPDALTTVRLARKRSGRS